uniref:DnaJ homolog subfamily B member 9 n=1 Tax=Caligus clemensi TaxID=344056 RepID=C1C021_CALCM|nr:DnaJ homolog subfamily B member 9 [Caligus clemensi]
MNGVLPLWTFLCISVVSALGGYYKTLGLQKGASSKDIKKAFRQLALKYHPDKNNSPDAEKKFREIAEAYEVLSDERKRAEYDAHGGSHSFTGGSGSRAGNFHFNFDEFFSQFEDDIFGDINMKSHFSSHFDNHFRSHAEATGGGFDFEDFLNDDDMFGLRGEDLFAKGSGPAMKNSRSESCHTVTQRVGNTITSYTTCS